MGSAISLEMTNNGNVDVELVAGESRVCQLMFLKISRKLTRAKCTVAAWMIRSLVS
jgi:hypothetical protein